MTKIRLGLDLGTASIGYSLVKYDDENNKLIDIIEANTLIIDSGTSNLTEWLKGKGTSKLVDRRIKRSARRMNQRKNQRRERLHRVLNVLNFLPKHYSNNIDFENKLGQFTSVYEPKIQYDGSKFLFADSYNEMVALFNKKKVSNEWLPYYLRVKGLTEVLSPEELSWVLLLFNQKRGYSHKLGDDEINEEELNDLLDVAELEEIFFDHNRNYTKEIVTRENDIRKSKKTLGQYIFNSLLKNPTKKIKGTLVRTISREFYQNEMESILRKQIELQPHLFTKEMFNSCVDELYRSNKPHADRLKKMSVNVTDAFVYLFSEDIIFYQRPLKSQKNKLSKCGLEYYLVNGEKKYKAVTALSNPYFQQFRLINNINNLVIEKDGEVVPMKGIKKDLYKHLSKYDKFDYNIILNVLDKIGIIETYDNKEDYKLNISKDKSYPSFQTKHTLKKALKGIVDDTFVDKFEYKLWHIIYTVRDYDEKKRALTRFATTNNIEDVDLFVEKLIKVKFALNYASYSEKALKKLLKFMKFEKVVDIDSRIKNRIDNILDGVVDESICMEARNVLSKDNGFKSIKDFKHLTETQAKYLIYNKHSELDIDDINTLSELKEHIRKFNTTSLNNVVQGKVTLEAMRLIANLWEKHGDPNARFIDQYVIEMARENRMGTNARKNHYDRNIANENINKNIWRMLELLSNGFKDKNTTVVPNSNVNVGMSHAVKLKLYIDGLDEKLKTSINNIIVKLQKDDALINIIGKIRNKYISVYSGNTINLDDIFDKNKVEKEHILPKSLVSGDSFNNLVLAESHINANKGNRTARKFIDEEGGANGILDGDAYTKLVLKLYGENSKKTERLLAFDVSDVKLSSTHLNNTRSITKGIGTFTKSLVNDKHNDVIYINGINTSLLAKDWNRNDITNNLLIDRFIKAGKTKLDNNGNTVCDFGVGKPRFDHRNHTLDAIIISCVTKGHVQLITNALSSDKGKLYSLKGKLMNQAYDAEYGGMKFTDFKMPCDNFVDLVTDKLKNVLTKHIGNNKRMFRNSINYYYKFVNGKKTLVKQTTKNKTVVGALHQETYTRVKDNGTDKIAIINKSIVNNKDTKYTKNDLLKIYSLNVRNIFENYMNINGVNKITIKDIQIINKDIKKYNNGMKHYPIYNVKVWEKTTMRFSLSNEGVKSKQYVENDTTEFFLVYKDAKGKKRGIAFSKNDIASNVKNGRSPLYNDKLKNIKIEHILRANDLVFLPNDGEEYDINNLTDEQLKRVFRVNNFNKSICKFVDTNISMHIHDSEKPFEVINKVSVFRNAIPVETCL